MTPDTAPQPSKHGTISHLPARKPTIAQALRLLELKTKPQNRQELRERMTGWRHGPAGPWGCACGTVDEWIAVQECRDVYIWLRAQLTDVA